MLCLSFGQDLSIISSHCRLWWNNAPLCIKACITYHKSFYVIHHRASKRKNCCRWRDTLLLACAVITARPRLVWIQQHFTCTRGGTLHRVMDELLMYGSVRVLKLLTAPKPRSEAPPPPLSASGACVGATRFPLLKDCVMLCVCAHWLLSEFV